MKLKDFKKLNEGWNKWRLAESKLQYSVVNTGYGDVYRFYDESGEETEQSFGNMVLDLVDAGVGGWAPEEQIDRMMAVNADPNKNQGGMQKWDHNVFEDYYDADNQKILSAWAQMNGMELEQVPDPDAEEEYEDDGTYDFESTYSESKLQELDDYADMGAEGPAMRAQDQIEQMYQEQAGNIWHYIKIALEVSPEQAQPLWEAIDEDWKQDGGTALEERISPEQEEANEKAYSRCFEMGRKGVDVKTALRSGPVTDFKACRAGHEDGANEFRQSLPSEHDLEERIKKAVVRKLKERKKK